LTLSEFVYDSDGRIVAVHPETHMVEPMVACVTEGLRAPGVRPGSGSPGSRSADDPPPLGGMTPVALAAKEGPALPEASSSASVLDGWGDADGPAVGAAALGDSWNVALPDTKVAVPVVWFVATTAASGPDVARCRWAPSDGSRSYLREAADRLTTPRHTGRAK
jgi:hypothetical protein